MRKIRCSLIAVVFITFLYIQASAEVFSNDPLAIEHAAKSVVMLEVYNTKNNTFWTGSGFVAFNNYTLITNYHVINSADRIVAVSDDDERFDVTSVLAFDKDKDIAICEFSSPTPMPALGLQTNNNLARGQSVVVIGSPMGRKNTVSKGNISRLFMDNDKNRYMVQITAPAYFGNSGCPVLDDEGNVIAIQTERYTDGENENLAVHISEAVILYENRSGEKIPLNTLETERMEGQSELLKYLSAQPVILDEDALEYRTDDQGNLLIFPVLCCKEDAGKTATYCWISAAGITKQGQMVMMENYGWGMNLELRPGETKTVEEPGIIPGVAEITQVQLRLCHVKYDDGTEFEIDEIDDMFNVSMDDFPVNQYSVFNPDQK